MALRAPALFMGTATVQHPAQNDRLGIVGLFGRAPSGQTATVNPLTGQSGVIAGPAGTMGEVTLLSNTQYTVNPARWLIQGSASALAGMYEVINDAVETLNLTAQHASQYRKSYFGVWVSDLFVAGSGDDLPHWGLQDGALAASNPALPVSLPANFLAIGEFLIPPVGQAVTWTPYDVRTASRHGILPTTATDVRVPAFTGQYRDHPTKGLQRGAAGAWGLPNLDQPAFRFIRTQLHAVANGTWTPIFWDTEVLDTDDMWSVNPSTQVTCKRAGWWDISCGMSISGLVNCRRVVNVYKNGAGTAIGRAAYMTNVQADLGVEARGLLQLAVNDVIELDVYQDSGGAQNTAAGGLWATTYMQGLWVRP